MPERWVRPPLLGREAPSARAAAWRFRLLALLTIAVLVTLVVLGFRQLSGGSAEDPRLSSLSSMTALPLTGEPAT